MSDNDNGLSFINGLFGLGSTGLSLFYNSKEARKQRDWATQEAQKQRDWQTEMANTAVTRRMADLRNNDLNPLLAITGASSGAAVPSGGISSGSTASSAASIPNPITETLNQRNIKSQSKLNEANAGAARANEANANSQTKYNLAAIRQLDKQLGKIQSEINMNATLNASNAEDLKFKKQKNAILIDAMKKNPMAVFQNEFGGNQGAVTKEIQTGANMITDKLQPLLPAINNARKKAVKFANKVLTTPNPHYRGPKKLNELYKRSYFYR